MEEKELLEDINRQLPLNIDWKAGALRYVNDAIGHYDCPTKAKRSIMSKPFQPIGGENWQHGISKFTSFLNNLANTLQLLQLEPGSKILDVACGAGWLSEILARVGYSPAGVDISPEFIEMTRERMAVVSTEDPRRNFLAIDVETEKLPDHMTGTFRAAIFLACLHHFHNPIAALRNIGEGLAEDGVLVIIEGHNLRGKIREDWVEVMRDTHTIERPYSRENLVRVLEIAGFPAYEVVAAVNGFYPRFAWNHINTHAHVIGEGRNYLVAARSREPLRRIFPQVPEQPPQKAPSPVAQAMAVEKKKRSIRTALRSVWKAYI
jgi:SAM-dependent methyltransferase